ncbi:aspartate/glutamate racemase family protein [Paenibacillaceae bacterium WGS1546]|uniref:aspartate/glutamate racemase family protein n=1 Tax=Cohnella sp. WGS1546 TaxID=3366810 RepID=UPI00372D3436
MKKLAIIHTTTVTVEALAALAREKMPGIRVINFVDDSILPQLADNGGDVAEVSERLCAYAGFAERQGADCILSACSSVGDAAADMRSRVAVPVVRIDEPIARLAVRRGPRIGVAATLHTTMKPTMKLLAKMADLEGVSPAFAPVVCEAAYRRLAAGDKEGHDRELALALAKLAESSDAVVLAQASMARVVAGLPESIRDRFLSSPGPAMDAVAQALGADGAEGGGRS